MVLTFVLNGEPVTLDDVPVCPEWGTRHPG